MNYFEYATRNKIRFQYRGVISVEDLWDLPLKDLDAIYKELSRKAKDSTEESLLKIQTKVDEELAVAIELIKYIVNIKQDEAAKKLRAKELREQKQRVMEIIETKRDADLQNKSVEELTALLNSIGEV